jgi:hypothetical protein
MPVSTLCVYFVCLHHHESFEGLEVWDAKVTSLVAVLTVVSVETTAKDTCCGTVP